MKKVFALWLFFIFFLSGKAMANGAFFGPPKVSIDDAGQNAIVAWDGRKEVLILSLETKTSASTPILHAFPLPSSPEIKAGDLSSFAKLTQTINRKLAFKWNAEKNRSGALYSAEYPGVEVTLHETIGAHDVTVVKIADADHFVRWANDFAVKNGLDSIAFPASFKETVQDYLNRGFTFFVFDIIPSGQEVKSVSPLVYSFETKQLYYPLKATAASQAGHASSLINLFLISRRRIDPDLLHHLQLWPSYDYIIRLTKAELAQVHPDLLRLFLLGPYPVVYNVRYYGPLDRLSQDLLFPSF